MAWARGGLVILELMYALKIERRFFASHALRLYDGSLEPLHAHDWVVEAAVRAGKLDAIGVVMDFHELERIVAAGLEPLRGVNLNECAAFAGVNPTAECVAEHIYGVVAAKLPVGVELVGVTVTESPGCEAMYSG